MGNDEIAIKSRDMFNDMMTIESHFENVGYRGDDVMLGIKELADFIRFYQPAKPLKTVDVEGLKREMFPDAPRTYEQATACAVIDHLFARGCFGVPQWQPIETAPKDGKRILLYNKYGAGSGHFDEKWHMHFAINQNEKPTHWMPLPAAPKKED